MAAKVLDGPQGPTLLLVGAAASLLEGDRVEVDVRVGPESRLTVRTVAATLAHPCPGGTTTAFDVRASVGAGGRLAWLPEPLVAFAGCRHRGVTQIRLDRGAVAVSSEALALGRTGEIAGDLELRLDVELDGRPLLRDGLRVNGAERTTAVAVGGARHVGTVALLGATPDASVPDVMALAGPGAIARGLADDGAALTTQLSPALRAFLNQLEPEALSHVA
jgi:urease accessory protein